ncbi:MAG: T9SS type A sorting domain-containing protein [Flavobacteriaceae bacterium]|nr:T9SS type A sorting domain-containing protein [Flavobacteriaceae bacterium]
MRYNLKPVHLLWIFGATLSVVLHFSDDIIEPQTSSNDWDELNKQYPGEWFYNERAYPDGIINVQAIKEAELQAKEILTNRLQPAGNWELNGPLNTGGRITDIALSPNNDDVFYAGAATGGIFKTTDRGVSWTAVFDEQAKLSIGDIAIAPSNANTLYVGTGEANGSVNTGAFFGDGIYKSTDAGATWSNVGLPESNHIGRIVVDPTDEDRVFVAATGKLYGYNPERGIYRTTDGGSNWEQVLHVTDSTAAIDVAMNPSNTDIVFAAMWERTRQPWIRDYGGVTSAIHRTMDGGNTWEELGAANGLPAPDAQTGRIGLAISQSDPSTIYARYTTNEITNTFNGLYKSTDNGENWTLVTLTEIDFVDSFFGWYFGNLRVNPTDPDQVYILGQLLFRTDDSGDNWSEVNGMHVDHHAMEFSNNDSNFILAGNDGGLYRSEDGGSSWIKYTNLPITQFYNIEVDFLQPERLYGGTQDNNTIRTITGGQDDWNPIWGGDGFHVNVDYADNNFIYVESQFGNLGRSINGGNTFVSALDGIDPGDRNNWNTPVIISPFDNERVYYGTNRLYSSNRAVFWTAISPDLTDGPHPSGATSYGTLTAIGASHLNLNTIYTGSDDGNVNVTFDGGTTWTNISAGLPDRYITSIAVSPSDDLTAYVALSGYQLLDYDPHIFKTTDGGQNWTAVSGNLPDIPVNDILINSTETTLFAATDLNVWYSEDDGTTWTILGDNLPLTLTRDLKLHEPTNTLYAGTYGRSIHSFDLSQVLDTEDYVAAQNSVIVYPVPSSGEINIQHALSEFGSINLFDVMGRNVKALYQGDLSLSNDASFSIGELPAGVYFVQIRSGNQKIARKIVKR